MTEITYPYKFKLKPTEEQREVFRQYAGTRRYLWNNMLDERNKTYEYTGSSPSMYKQKKRLTKLKNNSEEHEWMKDIHSQVLQETVRDLDSAFEDFFNKSHGYPNFKSKKEIKQTFRFPQGVKVDGRKVYLPKIGWIRFYKSQNIEGEIKSATVKRQANGWFISINTEQEIEVEWKTKVEKNNIVGIDLGLKDFAVMSDGTKVNPPKYLREMEDKLIREQRKLSRKEYGSENWKKQKRIVAKIHADIRSKRQDFLHKLSSTIVAENQCVVVEDLNVKGMTQNHNLAKSIHDASWSEFVRMLEYKCQWSGTYFVKIDRFEPSSKTCRHCGVINDIELSDRTFECSGCGAELMRDYNASLNIKRKGIEILAGRADHQSKKASGETTSGHTNGGMIEVESLNEEPSGVAKVA